MVYKDKDKQRAADRARQQRRRDAKKVKGVTIAGRDEGVTLSQRGADMGVAGGVTVEPVVSALPISQGTAQSTTASIPNYGQPDCECMHCKSNRANGSRHTLNHNTPKKAVELADNELNRVSLPSDPDYKGVE